MNKEMEQRIKRIFETRGTKYPHCPDGLDISDDIDDIEECPERCPSCPPRMKTVR